MTFAAALGWSLLRSCLIAVLGVCLAKSLQHLLTQKSKHSTTLWIAVMSPFFTPSLMTGFCYRDTAMSLVHTPLLKEVLYALITAMQLVPVAVVLLMFAPIPQVSTSALHISKLTISSKRMYLRLLLRSKFQHNLIAGSLLFLLSFQEAELASLMQAASWTEWLFTKHAGGLLLAESLRLSVVPMLVQLPCLLPLIWWLEVANDRKTSGDSAILTCSPGSLPPSMILRVLTIVWIGLSLAIVTLLPMWQLLDGAMRGSGGIWNQPTLAREICDSLLIALTCGSLALCLGLWLQRTPRYSMLGHKTVLFILLIPGCVGNLVLGLLFAGIFQTPLLQFAYDSPVPLILAEVCWLFPRTIILLTCLARSQSRSAQHQIVLLKQSPLVTQQRITQELYWQLTGKKWLAVTTILCFWSYLELMLPSILVFPGMAPVSLVLYNAMHYGRISVLGTKLLVTLFVPVVLVYGVLQVRRILLRS